MRLEIKLNVNIATGSIFKYVFLNYVKIFKCEKKVLISINVCHKGYLINKPVTVMRIQRNTIFIIKH